MSEVPGYNPNTPNTDTDYLARLRNDEAVRAREFPLPDERDIPGTLTAATISLGLLEVTRTSPEQDKVYTPDPEAAAALGTAALDRLALDELRTPVVAANPSDALDSKRYDHDLAA